MSDMMRGMQGGMPQGMPQGGTQGMPGGGMDVRSKMSILNPTDMAAKVSRGDVRPQQSVGEFLQRNYGVSPQDPVEKLFAAVKAQGQNATVPGKMRPQGMPGGMPGGMPQGMPPKAPGNMDELVSRIGG